MRFFYLWMPLILFRTSAHAIDWDDAAKIGVGLGAVACGVALVWEGVSHAHYYYQKNQIASVDALTDKLSKKYHFLLSSTCSRLGEVATLLVANVDDWEVFTASLLRDVSHLADQCLALQEIVDLGEFDVTYTLFIGAKAALEHSSNILPRLNLWSDYVQTHKPFFALFYHLNRIALPLYDVYTRYPVITYARALTDDRSCVIALYRRFALMYDPCEPEHFELMRRYKQRVSFLEAEIARVVESYAYQCEKESMAREEREREYEAQKRILDEALYVREQRALQDDFDLGF
ncbi:MAG: hypothetical protein UV79_C0008G0005 [candidate division TM6 bacterium GW2011_GWF2_43_17]|nr:MAG: hypothetical protein UV79_C0008G0005 [candidate division TM6 bacterium GW2011_GWF2_43_17]HAU30107.1 hypothetical protein [Candidatus Dependentiae bacterium]